MRCEFLTSHICFNATHENKISQENFRIYNTQTGWSLEEMPKYVDMAVH